jgi:hypothetical protein
MKRFPMLELVLLVLLAAACSGPAATSVRPPQAFRTSFTSQLGTIGVPASNYRVVVTTVGKSWVQVVGGAHGANAIMLSGVLPAGKTYTFSAQNGKLTVQVGSAQVRISVLIGGERVPRWQYTPTITPYTLAFTSVS